MVLAVLRPAAGEFGDVVLWAAKGIGLGAFYFRKRVQVGLGNGGKANRCRTVHSTERREISIQSKSLELTHIFHSSSSSPTRGWQPFPDSTAKHLLHHLANHRAVCQDPDKPLRRTAMNGESGEGEGEGEDRLGKDVRSMAEACVQQFCEMSKWKTPSSYLSFPVT